MNASWTGSAIHLNRAVNISLAIAVPEGVIGAVIPNAATANLAEIATQRKDLAERAKSARLRPTDITGGTFTITNPGPFGTYITLPIINQPQVAVLSTDSVRKRPTVVPGPDGSDSIAVRHIGILALAWDHRAFDGAYAAAFLGALRQDIETRDWKAELA